MKKAFIVFFTVSFFWFAAPARPARADSIGTIVVAAVVAVVALGAVSAVTGSQRDIVKIEADKRVRLEEIRANTVLEAPCRLGNKGSASYESTEGDAKIRSEVEGAPCPSPILMGSVNKPLVCCICMNSAHPAMLDAKIIIQYFHNRGKAVCGA